MAQPRYCPDCRQPVGTGEETVAQWNHQVTRHRGSRKCKQAQAQNAAAGYLPDKDRLPYVVRFEATKKLLQVRLEMGEHRLTPGGNYAVVKPSKWANFTDAKYETRSLREVMLLRDARNNGANIDPGSAVLDVPRLGINAHMWPDRFYEIGCFDPLTGEEIDPGEYVALEVLAEEAGKEQTEAATNA